MFHAYEKSELSKLKIFCAYKKQLENVSSSKLTRKKIKTLTVFELLTRSMTSQHVTRFCNLSFPEPLTRLAVMPKFLYKILYLSACQLYTVKCFVIKIPLQILGFLYNS